MAKQNQIDFQLNFRQGDTTVLKNLKKDIAEIQRLAADVDFTAGLDTSEIQSMINAARTLDSALDRAFDVNLNTINVQKFNQILAQSGYNAETLQADLAMAGVTGQQAFLKATGQLMQFNSAARQSTKLLDNLSSTLFNTIKYTISNAVINKVIGSVQTAYYYIKDLDRSLNDIRIVTNKSADDMAQFAVEANNAAKALAVTTEDYTQGALIYYQQGLDDETVKTLTDITAMTSNVTGQSMGAVSEQLTAVQNGYQVANQAAKEGMQVYTDYVDKMAAVGAAKASDLEELSIAMSKVASAASSMGVGFDDLNAQIATIISVTRQAPESVGTALKTIYARLGDLKVDGVDEFGTKLGEVSSQLQTMGVNILDSNGDMRQMSDVIAEVAEKQQTWTSAQREAAAVAMAGKRQYNNLVALFDNWDMYGDALETSMGAAGTLMHQQEIAMESLDNKLDVLKTIAEGFYSSLFDTDTIVGFVEAGTKLLEFLTNFSDSIGGLNNLLPMLGSLGFTVFNEQIGRGLANVVINARNASQEAQMAQANFLEIQNTFKDTSLFRLGNTEAQRDIQEQEIIELKNYYSEIYQYQSIMTKEQKEQYNTIKNSKVEIGNMKVDLQDMKDSQYQTYDTAHLINSEIVQNLDNTQVQVQETEKINKILTGLEGAYASIGDDLNENINIIKNQLTIGTGLKENDLAVKRLSATFRQVYNDTNNEQKALEAVIQQVRNIKSNLDGVQALNNKIKDATNSTEILGNSLKENLQTQQLISNITKITGAIGQLAFSMQSLKNIGNIFDNEDISNSERFSQILYNLGFTLPFLATSLETVLIKIDKATHIFSVFTQAIEQNIAAKKLKQISDQVGLETSKLLQIATNKETLATHLARIAKNDYAIANGISVDAIDAETLAEIKETAAKQAEIVMTKKATLEQEKLNAVILSNPYVLAIAGIMAFVGAMVALTIAQQRAAEAAREARIEEQRQYEEQRNNKRQEIEDNQALLKSYNELYENYKKGITTKDQLANKTEELKNILNDEDIAVATLTDDYEALNQKILEYRKLKTQEKIEQNQQDINTNKERLNNLNEEIIIPKPDLDDNLINNIQGDELLNQIFKLDNKGNLIFSLDVEDEKLLKQLPTAFIKLATLINDSNNWNASSQREKVVNFQGSAMQYYSNINAAEKDNEILKLEEEYYNKQIESFEDYNDAITDLEISLRESQSQRNASDDEIFKEALNILKTTQTGIDDYETRALAVNSLVQKFGSENEQSIRDTLTKLSSSEIKSLLDLSETTDQETLSTNLSYYLDKAGKDFVDKIAKDSYNASTSLLNEIQAGNVTSENATDNDNYKTLLNNLNAIKDAYPDIVEEANIVEKTWLIGTQEYNEALEKIQDKLYKLSLSKAVKDVNTDIDELLERFQNIEIDDSNIDIFKNKLDEILNAQYEIDVQIHTEADQEFSNISNAFDQLDKMASKIEKNFIVAANDIRALNNTFPGIIEGMQYLEDGTVKLNQDIVKSAMAAAEAEVKADAEATVAKLENQANLLRAKQRTYQNLANAALILAEGEVHSEEEADQARATMSSELAELKELNSQESANSEMNNAKEVADNSYTNAQITGANQTSAFRQMAEASYEGAKTAIQNMNAVASKDAGSLTSGNFSSENLQYGGTTGLSGDASIISATEKALKGGGNTDQAAVAEKYAQLADSAGEAANDIDGMIMQLGAKSIEIDKNLGSIASGKGPTSSKSSGDSSKDKSKDTKDQEDEFDRYQEIKKAIDMVDRAMSRLDKTQEKLFGRELIQSLKQENALLAQQKANYEALYEMQQVEAAELRAQLGTMGVMFDASGAITNYAAATSAALQVYAAAIEQYNAGLIDETTLGVYEKSYENFKKLLERYDTLFYTEMQDTQDKIAEAIRKQKENNLQAWEIEIELQLETTEARRDQNDFLKDIKQDFRKIWSDLTIDSAFDRDNFNEYLKDVDVTIKAIKDVEGEIDKMMAGGESDMFESVSQAQEKLKELQEQLLEQGQNLYELYKQIQNNYIDGIDQAKDQFDELMKRYENFSDELEFERELIELIYGEDAYDLMNKYYEAQEKNTLAQIDSLKQQVSFWQDEFNKSYEMNINHGVDLDDFTTQTEDMKKAYDNMIEAQGDLNDLILEGVKILQDKYLNSINQIMDAMDKGIWGKGGFDEMKENQEFMQKKADEFLDDVQGAYKIQSLANKIDQSLNDNNLTVKSQQKLQKLREQEIAALREKENLTQADIDLAEARYQIALKEIALEDAQANKTSMKLVRNEQGNWSYQYVADEDDVASKQDDLLQSYADLYELANESYAHSMELVMDLYDEMQQKLADIAEKYADNPELMLQKQQELQEQYLPLITAAAENAELYKQETMYASAAVFQEVCEQDAEAYSYLNELQQTLVDELKDKSLDDYEDLRTAIIEDFYPELGTIAKETFEDTNTLSQTIVAAMIGQQVKDEDSFKNNVLRAIDEMQNAVKQYEAELDNLQKIAGIDFGKIGEAIDTVSGKIDAMSGTTERMVDTSSAYLDELRRMVMEVESAQNSVINKILEAQAQLQSYLSLMGQAQSVSSPGGGSSTGGGSAGSPGGSGTETGGGKKSNESTNPIETPKEEEKALWWLTNGGVGGKRYISGYGTYGEAVKAKALYKAPAGEVVMGYQKDASHTFNTGGYTGEQANGDNDGKLAFLHQKELVLNAGDTKNFLSGISMIRDMTSLNGSITNSILKAISNMAIGLATMKPSGVSGSPVQNEENSTNIFNITAEFPNANDVNDIREAILSLPNMASQYINKVR